MHSLWQPFHKSILTLFAVLVFSIGAYGQAFVKNGNNGTVSCNTFCAGANWGPTGVCLDAKNEATQTRIGCNSVPGLLSGNQLTCSCVAPFVKNGNNGTVSCNTFCGGANWGATGTCYEAKSQATQARLECGAVPGLQAAGNQLTCSCIPPFVKNGNNGTVSCNTFCAGANWGSVGSCVDAKNEGTQAKVSCDNVPGLLGAGKQLTCSCVPPFAPKTTAITFEIYSGDKQTKSRNMTSSGIGMAIFDPFIVKLTYTDGAPVVGALVTWAITSPRSMAVDAGNAPNGGEAWKTIGTDALGLARLQGGWPSIGARAYYGDGSFTVTATYGGRTLTFSETVGGAPAVTRNMTIVSGNSQFIARGTISPQQGMVPGGVALFVPLKVKLTNLDGSPVVNEEVFFQKSPPTPNGMAVQFDQTMGGQPKTDANGIASTSNFRTYYSDGPFAITASAANAPQAIFNFSVLSAGQFVKHGNNGTVSGETYCTGKNWPGGTGHCLAAVRSDNGVNPGCAAVPGLLPAGQEFINVCGP